MFPNGIRLSRCYTGRTDYDTPKGRGMNQDAFTRALLRPDLPTPSDIIAPAHDSATRRFAVYRNNVIASLSDALETAFPAIRALLGDTNFRNIAGVYCRAHPPTLPIMQQFGADFGVFLDGFEPVKRFPYLPDIAKIEIALRQAYHAPDTSGDAAITLGTYTPDQIARARFTFAPAVQLIDSAYAIYDIWNKAHDPNYEITHQGQSIVILRPEFDPFPHLLSHAEHLFLRLMMDQSNLGDATERAHQHDPHFDPSQILQTLLTNNALDKVTQ